MNDVGNYSLTTKNLLNNHPPTLTEPDHSTIPEYFAKTDKKPRLDYQ